MHVRLPLTPRPPAYLVHTLLLRNAGRSSQRAARSERKRMALRTSRKGQMELGKARDFPGPTPIQKRYAILSSPRSGSTLLGRMLFETKVAGDPLEYFNRNLLRIQRETLRKPALSSLQLLNLMEPRRTSPNGMFGMKMHYQQFLAAYQSDFVDDKMLRFLRAQHSLIWIRRRDRLRQAISYAIAIKSNAWSSEEPTTDTAISVNMPDCVDCLREICWDDLAWNHLIDTAGLNVHVVWYEDLITNYEPVSRDVLRHLGLDQEVGKIPPPPISRQAGDRNEQLYRSLCDYLGCSPSPR